MLQAAAQVPAGFMAKNNRRNQVIGSAAASASPSSPSPTMILLFQIITEREDRASIVWLVDDVAGAIVDGV